MADEMKVPILFRWKGKIHSIPEKNGVIVMQNGDILSAKRWRPLGEPNRTVALELEYRVNMDVPNVNLEMVAAGLGGVLATVVSEDQKGQYNEE